MTEILRYLLCLEELTNTPGIREENISLRGITKKQLLLDTDMLRTHLEKENYSNLSEPTTATGYLRVLDYKSA